MVTICCYEIWVLWDNIITAAMEMQAKKAFFYMLLFGNNALKRKSAHSFMACYVGLYVLLYNAAKRMFTR
jgi:hypothetical protein